MAGQEMRKSWAVITGGSDGIGFAMAKNLAANTKFNICLIGRNAQKMEQKLEEVKQLSKHGIQTKYVVADFDTMFKIEDYEAALKEPLASLDIGLLILNAGWATMGPFEQLTNEEVQRTININILHVAYCAKVLATQLVSRFEITGKKTGLIITSSQVGLAPTAGTIAYSCGKAFDHYLALGLGVEFAGKVDVISYNPGGVNTPFLRDDELRKEIQAIMISPELAASTCFRDLGYQESTMGAFKHYFINWMTPSQKLLSKQFYKMSVDIYKKEKERELK